MPRVEITEVGGFDELSRQIKRLSDRIKRTELLKLMRKVMRPVVHTYRANLPEQSGVLKGSVAVKTVPSRKSGGNPSVAVRPGKSGKKDAAKYMFSVVPRGTKVRSTKRGSRKGFATVVPLARDRTLGAVESGLVTQSEAQTAAFVQKQIDRLSK